MLEIIKAGGWVMYPLLLCSLAAMAIVAERFWTLQPKRIAPQYLLHIVAQWQQNNQLNQENKTWLSHHSPLGHILAIGLDNVDYGRQGMKESMEEAGGKVVHELSCFLTTLGTIATISPLLGLLGTVIGMIDVFAVITTQGVGNASALAGGISTALITTATGLSIAIPSLLFYRYLRSRVNELVVMIEHESVKMLDMLCKDKPL